MKFRNKTKINDDITINLTPLIDVVFLLLIFFMVSTTFKQITQLSVELPTASTSPTALKVEPIRVVIYQSGDFEINGEYHSSEDMKQVKQILALQQPKADTPLLIVGDKAAPHQALVTVLAAAAELKVSKIRIVAQFEKEIG